MNGLDPDRFGDNEIANENLQHYFNGICHFFCATLIPTHRKYDENFKPTDPNWKEFLKTGSLKQYIGQHFLDCRLQHKNHPHFIDRADDWFPEWYTKLVAGFETECARFQLKNGPESNGLGTTDTMPLYPETRTSCNDGKEIADYISAISLTSILKNILKSGHSSGISAELGPHQKRALVLMTWSAVGRGGEVKFQSFNEWNFDTGYEVLDIKWTEIKTLKKYSLLMVPDTRWLFDFYHCIGCYFAIENGLYRSEIAKKKGHLNVMFPVLYSIMDSQVAKKIGQILKNHLPKGTPKEVKNKISVKSLRCGGITLLSRHHEISDPRLCSRSGHSSGRNSDSYLDSSDLLLRLPGAMAMHGNKSLDSKISVYSLKMLPMDAVKRFIDEIFHISVPAFQPKGKLYVVTRICAASLIAHHRQVTADLGAGNTISKFLLAAARKAKIADARYPNINPELLLEKWSEEVLESYVESNVDFTKSSPCAVGTAHALDEVKTMFLEGELKQTRIDNARKTAENSVLSERLGHLETQLRASHIEHLKTQKKLAFIKTPDHDIADKKRKNEDFEILDSCAPSSPKRLHFSDMSMDVLAAFTSPSHTHPLALPTTPQQTAKRSITTSISSGKKLGDAGVTVRVR